MMSMIVLLDKELADGSLSFNTCKLAKKALKKRVTPHMLNHSSATYWAPKMNRYQLRAKYGLAFSSNMPDRYIERKGTIFDQISCTGGNQKRVLSTNCKKFVDK
jgi:hypothetical protein